MTLSGEIEICDGADPAGNDSQVTICDPNEEEETKVTICDDGCPEDATVAIGGTDTPSTGSLYSASGGKAPYTWSCSGASITSQGATTATIDTEGYCGGATITVTDSCGNSASKTVRLPSGQWVWVSFEDFKGDGCADWSYSLSQVFYLTCYNGTSKYYEKTQRHGSVDDCFSHSCPDKICSHLTERCLTCWERTTYEWRCP